MDRKYHGAGTEVIKDEGRRVIHVLDENWNSKSMNHRVADLRNPLVAASQTVQANNIVVMDKGHSFIAPLSSEFGWHLKNAIEDLTYRFGTGDLLTLYERNGIYCFDAWVKPGPQGKAKKDGGANAVARDAQVSERSGTAAPSVRVSTEVETKEYEIEKEESKWRPVPKKKAASKQFMAAYGHSKECKDGCTHDDGYWSGFTRRVPSWP